MIFLWIFNKNFIWSSVLLSLTTINLTTASNCRFEKNTTDEWSKLQSPGFPQRFPVQFQCYWKLTTIFTHRIKLQFTKIFLVKPDQDRVCNTQWISIVDKYRAPGPTEVKICGKANPGVAISTGNIFEITLFSNSKFERYDYQGFEVTFIMTLDSPVLPGLISPAVNRNQPRQTTAAIQTTKRSRQQNKFNSLNAGQSQSEKIEELNRKRNLGIQVMQNPVFENGLERRYFKPVPITKKTTTSLSANRCRDKNHLLCGSFSHRCLELLVRLVCPRTCEICDCELTTCEHETCVDIWEPSLCKELKVAQKCALSRYLNPKGKCAHTCGDCKQCNLPCKSDCRDYGSELKCGFVVAGNFCKLYPDASLLCPKSCEVCKKCPLSMEELAHVTSTFSTKTTTKKAMTTTTRTTTKGTSLFFSKIIQPSEIRNFLSQLQKGI